MITGAQLWNITIDEPNYSGSCNVADNGKVAILSEGGYYVAFDQATGRQVWKGEQMLYPWDAPAFGAYDVASAYGLIIRSAYSGTYAFDWNDGKIAWKYEAPANPFETPYINENGSTVYLERRNAQLLTEKSTITTQNTHQQCQLQEAGDSTALMPPQGRHMEHNWIFRFQKVPRRSCRRLLNFRQLL